MRHPLMSKNLLDDPSVAKLIRTFSTGEYFFRQGDMGETMYLLLDGAVLLFHNQHNSERLVGIASAGEVLGEKAILLEGPYRRNFTAQAKVSTVAIEFDSKNLKMIQSKIPDFAMMMVRILSARLDQCNQMVFILQSTDPVDRVIKYLLHFSKHHSKKVPQGVEFSLTAQEIEHAINLESDRVEIILSELVSMKVLKEKRNGYIIEDENALLDQASALRERTVA